ncbi:MAG: UvrD-helicase domain-containing protein [Dissulfurispiraceae bacterium]
MLKKALAKLNVISLSEHEKLVEKAREEGKAEGLQDGIEKGNDIGFKSGYEAGYKDQKISTEYRRLNYKGPFHLANEKTIFSPGKFCIEEEVEAAIKSELAEITEKEPHPSQWEMILSEAQNTCVIAGAGSGKSTSLVNRIILLDWYLKIPRDKITALTFTKESRKDLIKQLLKVYGQYYEKHKDKRLRLTKKEAEGIVRTFHSKIASLGYKSGFLQGKDLFEFAEKDRGDKALDDFGTEEFYSTNLGAKQDGLLRQAYSQETPIREEQNTLPSSLEIYAKENDREIEDFIERILSSLSEQQKKDNKTMLLILTRTRRKQKIFKKYADRHPNIVKVLTYHSSKGLEAPYSILVGDCFYKGRADFKDMVYRLARYDQTYDEAQDDEAMRLAYVALTRAGKNCYWFVEKKDGGAARIVDTEDNAQKYWEPL